MSSQALTEQLKLLKDKRKSGELDQRGFYQEILSLTIKMLQELKEEDISDENVKKQIPLMLVFLEEQLSKMRDRGS